MDDQANAKTALVLAGGGSFGAVQVGMLRELIDYGLKADFVVGSSVGAVNAAYFAGAPNASGVAHLEAIWLGLSRSEIFPLTWRSMTRLVGRRDFVIDPSGLRGILERHFRYGLLEHASLPVHVVATDLLGGGTVRLSSGPAVEAALASCAIPVAFPPVRIGGRYLIDGAVASNTPISVAVDLGATRVLVLPTGFACALKAPPAGAIACALQAIALLTAHQLVVEIEHFRSRVEVITVPPLCPLAVSPYDFSRAAELIERSAEQTRRWLEEGGLTRDRVPGALRAHTH